MLWASVGKLCVEKNAFSIFVYKTIERPDSYREAVAILHNDKLWIQMQRCGVADRLRKFHDPVAESNKEKTVEGYLK